MTFSKHSLHSLAIHTDAHKALVESRLQAIARSQARAMPAVRVAVPAVPGAPPPPVAVPLTTVSLSLNFDAYINIQFRGQAPDSMTSLMVDSGNSMLIVPYWEVIQPLAGYTVLGDAEEPWGCPAKVVRGPIEIPTSGGQIFTLEDCVFFACTAAPPAGGDRTANFGVGCLSPWSANGWATPDGIGVTMQAPLSYNDQYPFAEFQYAPAAATLGSAASPTVAQGSQLTLTPSLPDGYVMLNITPGLEWMSLKPKSLSIGGTLTQWPGDPDSPPIAMIDNGGGPVFLSDPKGYIYSSAWPHPEACPAWSSDSDSCTCIGDDLTVELEDAAGLASYKFTIRTSDLPATVQGLTLVACKVNSYMMGQQGMNVGGISNLFNDVLVDYANARVGLKPK